MYFLTWGQAKQNTTVKSLNEKAQGESTNWLWQCKNNGHIPNKHMQNQQDCIVSMEIMV